MATEFNIFSTAWPLHKINFTHSWLCFRTKNSRRKLLLLRIFLKIVVRNLDIFNDGLLENIFTDLWSIETASNTSGPLGHVKQQKDQKYLPLSASALKTHRQIVQLRHFRKRSWATLIFQIRIIL